MALEAAAAADEGPQEIPGTLEIPVVPQARLPLTLCL
jgi:hypothetical protein